MDFSGYNLGHSDIFDDLSLSKEKAEKMPVKKFTFKSPAHPSPKLSHSLHILHKNAPWP